MAWLAVLAVIPLAAALAWRLDAPKAVVVAWVWFSAKRNAGDPAVTEKIMVTPGGHRYSPDWRGTDAIATIDNTNPFAVKVTVVAKGLDYKDNVVKETTLGPYRLAPGGTQDLLIHFDATPLKTVTFEALRVEAARR